MTRRTVLITAFPISDSNIIAITRWLRVLDCRQENGRELLTLRNRHGNAPQKRFQTRPMGRAFKRCSVLKFPVSLRTAAEASQFGLLCFFWSLFLLTLTIEAKAVRQGKSPSFSQNWTKSSSATVKQFIDNVFGKHEI
jgi:hypothetical protein